MHAPQVQIQWYQNVVRGPTAEQPTVAAPVPSSNAPPPAFGIDPALLQAPPPTTPQSTSTTSAVAPRPAFGIDPALLLTAPREAPSFPTSTTHLALPGTNPSGEQGEEQRGESQAGVSTPARGSVEPRDGEPPADGPAGPGDKSSAEGATPPEEEASEEGTADMYENLNEPEETVEDFEEDSDGEFVARVDIKGRHVSSLNAKYGKVKGVGRGSRKWGEWALVVDLSHDSSDFVVVVARTIKMGPVYASQSDSSRAHNAMLRSLISKVSSIIVPSLFCCLLADDRPCQQAEHLSTRTKSWLYIAAQHPSSNLSFIHYASPKLRKNSESLAKLHRTASVVMGGLRDASRKTVTKLATQVREQEGTIKDLEKKIQDYESLLSSKEGDISCLTQAINVVRSHNPDILLSLASSTPKGNAAGM